MKKFSNILKVSFLIIAFAISLAILSACNSNPIPSEHFNGNCITKGFTRYYMPNGGYIDREDKDFGDHSYKDETVISEQSCTQDGVIKYTCEFCKEERFETSVKLGHEYVAVYHLEPTCTENGKTDYKCNRCNDTYTEIPEKLGHDYKETVLVAATCTTVGSKRLDCNRCQDSKIAEIDMLEHDYTETIIEQATCTAKGSKSVVCKACGHTEIQETDLLPHTPDNLTHIDSEAHWSVCTVCKNIYDYAKHDIVSKDVPSTCIDRAFTLLECRNCVYSRQIIDEDSPFADHTYEAYTCKHCQRDNMLDYLSVFNSKGDNESNTIDISSENMLVCFYDYLLAYHITIPKYIRITYKSIKTNAADSFLAEVRRKITATNWRFETRYFFNTNTEEVYCFCISAANDNDFVFSEAATFTPDKYDENTYLQYDSYQFTPKTTLRASTFDDFKYKERLNTINVTTSDQLFFAFEHGYKPIVEANSPAQKMLNKAKNVARRIMDDTMTDLQKVKAIYSYLVSNVAYDYGIVNLTSANRLAFSKCSSYYMEGVFDYGVAVCDGISKAFCVLTGLEDIKCVRVTSTNHAWNKVYIDVNGNGQKAWFGTDATWGNQGINYTEGEQGEYLTLEDFLFTDEQKTSRGQTGLNYADTNSNSTTEENPFEYFYFDEKENESCDFVIQSDTELNALIEYLKENISKFSRGNKVTVQIFIVSTYWAMDEISANLFAALRKQWLIVGAFSALTVGTREISYGNAVGCTAAIIIHNV